MDACGDGEAGVWNIGGNTDGELGGIISGSTMKTAISLEDGLLREADETARLMGLSRSGLFALAMGDFLRRQREERMLLRLNEVYTNQPEPAEKRLLKGIKAKVRRTVKDRW